MKSGIRAAGLFTEPPGALMTPQRWAEELQATLIRVEGECRGAELSSDFADAFPPGYRSMFSPQDAVHDIRMVLSLSEAHPIAMSLYRTESESESESESGSGSADRLRFKLFRRGQPLALSETLPMLEHMGMWVLNEHSYQVCPPHGGAMVSCHDFGLQPTGAVADVDFDRLASLFEAAFAAVLTGECEADGFNRLVMGAGMPHLHVVVLRAYAKYLKQLRFGLSQQFIESTLNRNPHIAAALVDLFLRRFDPDSVGVDEASRVTDVTRRLEAVANLSEDQVLRQFLALILATSRTNFWCVDGQGRRRPFLSFKFDAAKVPGMPEPRPMFEIFVYSPRFEGVHLRGGRVARGGLRWSDRIEDFRTEVLGLVKAQMVKNTVIVPVGSKGGFVLKRAPSQADREAYMAEGIGCYQDYLRGLLELTDNRTANGVVPPPRVRRHDGDDPYLVVAADKGTASFSDHANGISEEFGFWLGDAFASGGSVGYDHKVMGITARGAWESVKRHFRVLGKDCQASPFTVVGIGDMSGDVFGNGMLLSRQIRLVAAFDHRHIFVDPDPVAETSFAERERLFKLPRSSWDEYDRSLISAGGGVFERTVKAISLSPQVRAALGISAEQLTPADLVRAILLAPVDLLYNGGIGTYVKAATESNDQVGDRANDAVRVDGAQLRCKIVAEGGNLGCTQRGRIEFALNGGLINTDAIDNSAGVNTSDHEVNIKILLQLASGEGALRPDERNALLREMTAEVADLVLRDNVAQPLLLSVTGQIALQLLDARTRFMQMLEKTGRLNRAIEFLPTDAQLAQRRTAGLAMTSPECAVLMAYSKMWLYDELLASPLPEDPWIARVLVRYFPQPLQQRFAQQMEQHPLRREIVCTAVANEVVNRVGISFVHHLTETTGADPHDVVRAFAIAWGVFDADAHWAEVSALGHRVPDAVQARILIDISDHLERSTAWFLRSQQVPRDIAQMVTTYGGGVRKLIAVLPELLSQDASAVVAAEAASWQDKAVPQGLAAHLAQLPWLLSLLDVIDVVNQHGSSVETVARLHFELAQDLALPWLRSIVTGLASGEYWQFLARDAMLDDLSSVQRQITSSVLKAAAGPAMPSSGLEAWKQAHARALSRYRALLGELQSAPSADSAMLSVALRELRGLV